MRNKKLFKKLEIVYLLLVGKSEYVKEENLEYFRYNVLFIGFKIREVVNSFYGDYILIFFFEIVKLF